jgi:acylaminoacyl-peptidase
VVHFGQVIYHTDTEFYATGYESTPDDRLLGIKYCFNRPFGIWRISVTSDTSDLDEYSTRVCTADKLTPSHLSCRSPRIFVSSAGTKLVYLSSETGGAHASTNSLNAFDLPYSPSAQSTTLVPIVQDADPKSFPGLYPLWTLSSSFIVNHPNWNAPKIVVSSAWRSRNTILLIDTKTGQIIDLTPVDESNWSWSLLTTDNQDRIVCVRSAPNAPHQVLLGTISATFSVDWRVIHDPTLTEELRTALLSIETKIIPTPNRSPVETVVIRSTFSSQASRCILAPHGGPHTCTTTEFNPITSAFALEGCKLPLIPCMFNNDNCR